MLKSLGIAMVAAGAFVVGSAVPGVAATHQFEGRVVHVSTDNIKVENEPSGKVLSFIMTPHFDQVFQFDGKTTYQMKRLTPGKKVTVYYDERALGIRHVDRIVVSQV